MIRTSSFRRLNNIVFSKQYYCVLFSTNYISIQEIWYESCIARGRYLIRHVPG